MPGVGQAGGVRAQAVQAGCLCAPHALLAGHDILDARQAPACTHLMPAGLNMLGGLHKPLYTKVRVMGAGAGAQPACTSCEWVMDCWQVAKVSE